MRSLEIGALAQADLEDIFLDGLQRFGLKQAELFQAQIYSTFQLICETPGLGRAVDESLPGARSLVRPYPCRIFYRVIADRLVILRVIHGRQDLDDLF
ncbi:MAG: type II toxin-antitoxin system RelE/ParE family toxin [Hyphomonadaceae bacterium]|nr:type II toxin-antitoxin system RelE/ParE family toxin [Hyphomonadaceae bacterium]